MLSSGTTSISKWKGTHGRDEGKEETHDGSHESSEEEEEESEVDESMEESDGEKEIYCFSSYDVVIPMISLFM